MSGLRDRAVADDEVAVEEHRGLTRSPRPRGSAEPHVEPLVPARRRSAVPAARDPALQRSRAVAKADRADAVSGPVQDDVADCDAADPSSEAVPTVTRFAAASVPST